MRVSNYTYKTGEEYSRTIETYMESRYSAV